MNLNVSHVHYFGVFNPKMVPTCPFGLGNYIIANVPTG